MSKTPRQCLITGITFAFIAVLVVGMSGVAAAQTSGDSTLGDRVVHTDNGTATVEITVDADTFVTINTELPENWSVTSTAGPSGSEGSFVDGNYSWIQGGSGTYSMEIDVSDGEASQSGSFTVLRRVDSVTESDTFDATLVEGPVSVSDQSIPTNGGQVNVDIPASNYARIDISQLPDDWSVSELDPNGDVVDNTVTWIQPAADDSYSFNLTPPEDVSAGENVTFVATADTDINRDSFTVSATDEHESGTDQKLVNEVKKQAGNEDDLNSDDILFAWSTYQTTGSVGGTPVENPTELLFLWDWYVTNQNDSGA